MSRLDLFTDYLQGERRYSKHTVTAYIHDIAQFFVFIKQQYETEAEEEVRPQMIKAWLYELLQNEEQTARSVNRKLVALRSYYKFLMRTAVVQRSPLSAIPGIKTEKRLYQWIPEKNMEFLLEDVDFGDHFGGSRDKLVVELLYGTGMRRDELINLLEKNISVHEGTIKVLGKRAKERIIPIPKELQESIKEYRKEKETAGFSSEYLLLTDKGKKLYPMFVHRCVTQYISLVSSIDKNSPHILRHTYATHLLNKGADINAIKELLGHASLAATQVYTHNSIERLKTIYKQAHPKG